MEVKIELVYKDTSKNREILVTVKDGLKGLRLMNAVEKAVEKAAKDDKDWTRWNMLDIRDTP